MNLFCLHSSVVHKPDFCFIFFHCMLCNVLNAYDFWRIENSWRHKILTGKWSFISKYLVSTTFTRWQYVIILIYLFEERFWISIFKSKISWGRLTSNSTFKSTWFCKQKLWFFKWNWSLFNKNNDEIIDGCMK